MSGSILTNQGAMVALQTMKSITGDLGSIQDMISTGKKVANAKDNAAIWAISTIMESDVSAFKAVSDSLALGESTVAVARNAAEQVKDSLVEIKDKIISAQEENVDREKIQDDVDALRNQIKSIVGASQFNGLNLLKGTEDLQVLSSLDRASNGAVTTSTISVEAKSLDSGTGADSTSGTTVIEAVNPGGPNIAAGLQTGGAGATTATTGLFTNADTNITFATNTNDLDGGDTVTLQFSNASGDEFSVTYTHTDATQDGTGVDLATQLVDAISARNARDADGNPVGVDTGTTGFATGNTNPGDFDTATNTYYGTEGTFTFTNNTDLVNSFTATDDGAGLITITNQRDEAITVQVDDLTDYVQTNYTAGSDVDAVVAASANDVIDFATVGRTTGGASNGVGIRSDDTFTFTAFVDADDSGGVNSGDESIEFAITGADLTEAQLSNTLETALQAYLSQDINSGAGYTGNNSAITANGNGSMIINGATVDLTYTANSGEASETTQQALIAADLSISNSTATSFQIDAAAGDDYVFRTRLDLGRTADAATLDLGSATAVGDATAANTAVGTGTAGTLATDNTLIDLTGTNALVGDTVSVTLQNVNTDADGVAQPINYTVTSGNSPSQVATGLAAAINSQLDADQVTDFAAVASGTQVLLKNFNTTQTRDVSAVSSVNELSNAISATDVNGAEASSLVAGATNNITFAATTVSAGDAYEITVGNTTVDYVARDGDTLNDVGRYLEGLLKVNTADDITVDFTAVTDPTTTSSVLTVTNNTTTDITSFSATAKSGGSIGGGLELLDDIDVTTSSKAEGSLDLIEGLIEVAVDAASSYGSSEKRLESQQEFISKLTDTMKLGIGSLVDADLEEASARLQALQVQQQLGTQALSIANQAPQNILALFR